MQITAQRAVEKIRDYLVHKITLAELVDWAENSWVTSCVSIPRW